MFAPGGSTPLNTINFGYNELANDGAALTPDGTLLFAVTLASDTRAEHHLRPRTARARLHQHAGDLLAQYGRDRPGHVLYGHRY